MKGAVYSLGKLANRLVAGINSQIHVYKWAQREDGTKSYDIIYETGHHGHIVVLYVKTSGNYVLIGDLVRSITLLEYNPTDEKLNEISRDFNSF